MLIILERGYRDLQRLLMEQAANPGRALGDFIDGAYIRMSERHQHDFMHLQADPERRHIRTEFFAHQTLGVALIDRRALMADFS
jgi:hypothetical protein